MTTIIETIAEESGMTQYVAANNKYLERFAEELIKKCVDECVKVSYSYHAAAYSDSHMNGEGPDPYAAGAYYATIQCRVAIKRLLTQTDAALKNC